jgi:PEGA domain
MRSRLVTVLVLAAALAVAPAAEAHRHFHGGVSLWWGPWWWYGPWWSVARVPEGPPPDLGVVDTDVSPEGARVILDGQLIGTADDFDGYPDYLYLRPGSYTIEFRQHGYRSRTVQLDVVAGRYYPFDFKLERVPGERATPWYDRPSGLPIGRVFGPRASPAVPAPSTAPPARPDVSLRPELRSTPNKVSTGALDLRVKPATASVYVDGRFVGTSAELAALEHGLAVEAGEHRIDVVAPGFKARTVHVTVENGAVQQVVVELEAEGGQN